LAALAIAPHAEKMPWKTPSGSDFFRAPNLQIPVSGPPGSEDKKNVFHMALAHEKKTGHKNPFNKTNG